MRRTLLTGLPTIIVQPKIAIGRQVAPRRAAPTVLGPVSQLGMATPLKELLGSSDAEMHAELADCAALGAGWVRTDFWWDQVQPTADADYTWSKFDRLVAAAARYRLRVVAELHGHPVWVKSTGWMASNANQRAYARFAAAAAKHFQGRIQHWEIWNEQNTSGFWHNPDAADYTKALRAAYTAIKAVNPNDIVISGGLSPSPRTVRGIIGAADFLRQMYAHGAGGHFDALGFHPYCWPLMPNDTARWTGFQIMKTDIRDVMVANGDAAKQVWITEFGAPTNGGARSISQQAQSDTLQQASDFASRTPWVGPILWYTYQDRGRSKADTEDWFGLIGPGGERKLAYATFKNVSLRKYTGP